MRNPVRRSFVAAVGLMLSLSAFPHAYAQKRAARARTTAPAAASKNSFNVPVTY